jgi:N-acetylneuraminate synthase
MTLSRDAFGPDVPASLIPSELSQLVEGIRAIETMKANPVDKDEMARDMAPMRHLFTKSVVARVDLPAGTRLQKAHLTVKKPGTGIPANRLQDIVGRRVRRPIKADELLQEEDLELR